jgi:glycosyltransferase involved in cell wall biosynthesis
VRIAAVIPCYNAEAFLAQAIASVFAQTRQVDDIILVDDCSTDASVAIARRHGITVLSTSVNSGHAAARNIGIDAARAEVIAWLDADDYWAPNHVETVAPLLETFPGAAVAFSAVKMFGAGKNGIWKVAGNGAPANMFWQCLPHTIVPAMSVLTRRAALQRIGGFNADVRVAPDFDLWLRLSRHELFVNTEKVTSYYRWHAGQISRRQDLQIRSMYESRWRYLQTVDDNEVRRQLAERMIDLADADLLKAWYARDFDRLKLLLSLRPFLPAETAISRRVRWRSLLPPTAVRVWDAFAIAAQ